MAEMITAEEAQKLVKKHSMTSTTTTIQQYLPKINELIRDSAESGLSEVHWDCSGELNLEEDAKEIIKIQLYLESIGYGTKIVKDQDTFEDEDYDLYYLRISW